MTKSKMSLELPKKYSKEQWERGGSRPEHEKFIGMPVTSWSQVESWTATKGFNTGMAGKKEYMVRYFLGERFPDMGWGQFGTEVEDCVTLGECEPFTPKELETIKDIKPLGVFQEEIVIDFGDFCLLGYIDDMSEPKDGVVDIVRDYKTKSKSSKADLHDPKKLQLELYILGLQQRGLKVENAEYVIIERLGGRECMNGGGRESLRIGTNVWRETYMFSDKSVERAEAIVRETVKEISNHYKIFKILNAK